MPRRKKPTGAAAIPVLREKRKPRKTTAAEETPEEKEAPQPAVAVGQKHAALPRGDWDQGGHLSRVQGADPGEGKAGQEAGQSQSPVQRHGDHRNHRGVDPSGHRLWEPR